MNEMTEQSNKINDYGSVKISLASPEDIRSCRSLATGCSSRRMTMWSRYRGNGKTQG